MLLVCTLFCAFGMWINAHVLLSGFFMNLISIGITLYLVFQVANTGKSEETRMIHLVALAFQMGYLVGPAMHMLMETNPAIVF